MNITAHIAKAVIEKEKHDSLLGLYFMDVSKTGKFRNLSTMILNNPFVDEDTRERLIHIFFRVQKTYYALDRLRRLHEWKTAKDSSIDRDLYLNELDSFPERQKIVLLHEGTKYLFRLTDLVNIWTKALTESESLVPRPVMPKNPYTGIVFQRSHLYAIYFKVRGSGISVPFQIEEHFKRDMCVHEFHYDMYPFLKAAAIEDYMESSETDTLFYDIINMLCALEPKIGKRRLNEDMPYDSRAEIVTLLRPLLRSYFRGLFLCNPLKRKRYEQLTVRGLKRFLKRFPSFGRRRLVRGSRGMAGPCSRRLARPLPQMRTDQTDNNGRFVFMTQSPCPTIMTEPSTEYESASDVEMAIALDASDTNESPLSSPASATTAYSTASSTHDP